MLLSNLKYKAVIDYKRRFPKAGKKEIFCAFPKIDETIIRQILKQLIIS